MPFVLRASFIKMALLRKDLREKKLNSIRIKEFA
jgi:hypothetical protein